MGTKEDAYDNEIAPLMTQVIALARKHKIPMFATFQYTEPGTEEDDVGYCTTSVPFSDQSDGMRKLRAFWDQQRDGGGGFMLAETHVTNPDGSKSISIRRVT